MRLLVQGCLILGLLPTLSFAYTVEPWTGTPSNPSYWYLATNAPGGTDDRGNFGSVTEACDAHADALAANYANYNYTAETTYVRMSGNRYRCDNRTVNSSGNGVEWHYAYVDPRGCSEGDSSGFCSTDKTPEECLEQGELFDEQSSQCVTECPTGSPQLNGHCLPPEEDPECGPDSPDYRGELVLGYGQAPIPACGDFDQCSGDKPGQVGMFNGELVCLSEDYGAPKCKGGTIAVIDNYGFTCETLQNQPEEPETPEPPNTDTDGDGVPDEYQEKNDPESLDKGLNKVRDAIEDGNAKTDKSNQHLKNIETAIKGIADNVSSLEQMGKNGQLAGGGGSSGSGEGLKNEAGEDYLGDLADIKQNTKDTADTLNEIQEGPEGGYNTDGLGDAPTFSESTERLQLAITNNPTIQAVTTVPSIASNNTCPVWTIPATDFWQAMPIDSHCQILEDHRGLLSLLFIAVWTLAAVFVFLRA